MTTPSSDPSQPQPSQPDQPPPQQPQTVRPQASTPPPPPPGPGMHMPPGQPTNGLAIGGMVVSIVALVMMCCCGPFGVVLGITGTVLSGFGMKFAREHNGAGAGMAKAGLIMGIIAISINVVVFVLSFVLNFGSLMFSDWLPHSTSTPTTSPSSP